MNLQHVEMTVFPVTSLATPELWVLLSSCREPAQCGEKGVSIQTQRRILHFVTFQKYYHKNFSFIFIKSQFPIRGGFCFSRHHLSLTSHKSTKKQSIHAEFPFDDIDSSVLLHLNEDVLLQKMMAGNKKQAFEETGEVKI